MDQAVEAFCTGLELSHNNTSRCGSNASMHIDHETVVCRRVLAIDPAALSPDARLPNVCHIKRKAEDALGAVHNELEEAQADLLVCDMNQHPFRACEAVKALAAAVQPGGLVIMTMKFFGLGRDRRSQEERVTQMLGELVRDTKCLWLLSNTVNERTFVAWRA